MILFDKSSDLRCDLSAVEAHDEHLTHCPVQRLVLAIIGAFAGLPVHVVPDREGVHAERRQRAAHLDAAYHVVWATDLLPLSSKRGEIEASAKRPVHRTIGPTDTSIKNKLEGSMVHGASGRFRLSDNGGLATLPSIGHTHLVLAKTPP